jgi:hypothetical protein
MSDKPCKERAKLERVLIAAIEAVRTVKPKDRELARILHKEAAKALLDHIVQHGCSGARWSRPGPRQRVRPKGMRSSKLRAEHSAVEPYLHPAQ